MHPRFARADSQSERLFGQLPAEILKTASRADFPATTFGIISFGSGNGLSSRF